MEPSNPAIVGPDTIRGAYNSLRESHPEIAEVSQEVLESLEEDRHRAEERREAGVCCLAAVTILFAVVAIPLLIPVAWQVAKKGRRPCSDTNPPSRRPSGYRPR